MRLYMPYNQTFLECTIDINVLCFCDQESRPFTITGVVDPVSDETLTVSQAVDKGILDDQKTSYK